jgi:hypothetical protein
MKEDKVTRRGGIGCDKHNLQGGGGWLLGCNF